MCLEIESDITLKGFTLLELLTVISIIGILLAIAIPNYSTYMAHERRLTAKTELMHLGNLMESFYIQNNTYQGATLNKLNVSEFIAQNNYQLVIKEADKSHYELSAIPINQQAQKDAGCGTLSINSEGVKKVDGKLEECWYI